MRKCTRCNIEMIEDLDVKVEGGAYGVKVTQQGIFKKLRSVEAFIYRLKLDLSFFVCS